LPFPLLVENLDAVILRIRDVDVLQVHADADRMFELAEFVATG